MGSNDSSNDITSFRKALLSAKNVIAVAGAGLSAASGIPTFRGAGGLWRKFDAFTLATPEAFAKNPSQVWQFYHYRREKALRCRPNSAHFGLAKLCLPSFRAELGMDPDCTFSLITQNIDGISIQAMNSILNPSNHSREAIANAEPDPDHPRILEMHGRLFDVKCTDSKCGHISWDDSSPICPALEGTEENVDNNDMQDIPEADLPRCKKCGALARPGVVWFGETPKHLDLIDDLVMDADLCLVVGTSSTVYPAAGYAAEVQDNGGVVAVFNLDRSQGDENADFLFLGPCEETLVEALRQA